MVENIVETLAKSKALAVFLILWGATFLIRAIADLLYYIYNLGTTGFTETIVEVATWIVYDVVSIGAAIALFAIALKVLKAR